jgi:hypothetical protein
MAHEAMRGCVHDRQSLLSAKMRKLAANRRNSRNRVAIAGRFFPQHRRGAQLGTDGELFAPGASLQNTRRPETPRTAIKRSMCSPTPLPSKNGTKALYACEFFSNVQPVTALRAGFSAVAPIP